MVEEDQERSKMSTGVRNKICSRKYYGRMQEWLSQKEK